MIGSGQNNASDFSWLIIEEKDNWELSSYFSKWNYKFRYFNIENKIF